MRGLKPGSARILLGDTFRRPDNTKPGPRPVPPKERSQVLTSAQVRGTEICEPRQRLREGMMLATNILVWAFRTSLNCGNACARA